jgi:hypothetical protein
MPPKQGPRRKWTDAERGILRLFVAYRMQDAEKALLSLRATEHLDQTGMIRENIKHWERVQGVLRWCQSFIDRRRKRPLERPDNGPPSAGFSA